MKCVRLSLNILTALLLMLAFSALANAQASRTWVSGVGDDVNPCSRTAPCKTLAGAISKTAAGGEIDCLDPGGFGAVTITKAITIDCNAGVGSVLVAGTNGIVVQAGPNDIVYIKNLNINGIVQAGNGGINGIRFLAGKALILQHDDIFGFSNFCVDATNAANGSLVIENTNLSNCTQGGVNVTTSTGATTADLHNVQIRQTGTAINALGGARVNLRDCVITASTTGVAQATGSSVGVQGSTLSYMTTALQSATGASISSSGNVFIGNSLVYNLNGGSIFTGNDNPNLGNGAVGATSGALTKI